ncbi:hypothetical protein BD310DRAFT_581674 [Dichomitus squalens]|uniref:Uncharacterized protein n=1 Tax=Dichomitus squalens TaxID=114155 RepID=A0A4Q9Q7R1_9APHY|nr:hypothetical protein BD310DRAFT_581674 [Dichomitus squalens]
MQRQFPRISTVQKGITAVLLSIREASMSEQFSICPEHLPWRCRRHNVDIPMDRSSRFSCALDPASFLRSMLLGPAPELTPAPLQARGLAITYNVQPQLFPLSPRGNCLPVLADSPAYVKIRVYQRTTWDAPHRGASFVRVRKFVAYVIQFMTI